MIVHRKWTKYGVTRQTRRVDGVTRRYVYVEQREGWFLLGLLPVYVRTVERVEE